MLSQRCPVSRCSAACSTASAVFVGHVLGEKSLDDLGHRRKLGRKA
jgi:hypothetical protein